MEQLLTDWQLSSETVQIFLDNHIEVSQLHDLDDNILKELVPLVGERLKIKQKIKEWEENLSAQAASTFTITTSEKSSSIDEITAFSITENTPVVLDDQNLFKYLSPHYEDFDLKTLLSTSPLGKSVLVYYKTHNKLDNTRRNRLCSIIIKHLYTYIVNHRLKHEEYNSLAAKIIMLFPNELVGTYYVPPVRKNNNVIRKCIPAKGKLVNQVKNILFRSGNTRKRHEETNADEAVVPQKNILREPNDDMIWLSHNTEPWATVIEKWKKTYDLRYRNEVKNYTLPEYLQEWPVLCDVRGYILINLDFERTYPNSHLAFWNNWKIFFASVVEYKKDELKDQVALGQLETLSHFTEENQQFFLQLSILNYIFPPKGRIRLKNKQHWKFSIVESIEGMYIHVKNTGDVEDAILKTVHRAYERGGTIQPFLLIDGPSLQDIRYCYVVINHSLRYQFKNPLEAFDLLFKLFHSINICYPAQSEHIYFLIQVCVYKFRTKFDKVYPHLFDIENKFK